MGGERNPGREAHVRALTRLAQSNGLQGIAENSGRAKVSKLAEEILALDISQAVRKQVQRALDAYIATFGQAGQNVDASAAGAGADGGGAGAAPARALQSSATKVWKFMAVQLTYNSSHGDFASLEETVLRQLFSRFLAFLAGLARELKAEGTSATMEKASPLQVHLHAYLHLAQTFSSPWSRRLASVRVRRRSSPPQPQHDFRQGLHGCGSPRALLCGSGQDWYSATWLELWRCVSVCVQIYVQGIQGKLRLKILSGRLAWRADAGEVVTVWGPLN